LQSYRENQVDISEPSSPIDTVLKGSALNQCTCTQEFKTTVAQVDVEATKGC